MSSVSRKEGELTLLLDERFDIVWHSESLVPILGWHDVRGRNATEFVHPDDLGLVLETIVRVAERQDHSGLDPRVAPESSDIRIADVNGRWQTFETTTWNHLDDDDVRGVLCTCRRARDRSNLARVIEMLGSGAPVNDVIGVVARLADLSMGGGDVRTAIAWRQGDQVVTVTAVDFPPLHPLLAHAADLVWSCGLRSPPS